MKKFILAAVAATLVATPTLAAVPQNHGPQQNRQAPHAQKAQPNHNKGYDQRNQNRDRGHNQDRGYNQNNGYNQSQGRPGYQQQAYKPAKVEYRNNWKKGQRFDSRYANNYRQIDYRQHRGLKAPPRGYNYVQSGNDVVLVAIASGIIGAVFANLIR